MKRALKEKPDLARAMRGLPCAKSSQNTLARYRTFTAPEIIVLAIVCIVAIVALDLIFYSKTLEDAYITFRYSKHLAEGFGFGAWNTTGERVEGYTSFLWMLLLGITERFGLDLRATSKVLGIWSHIVLCASLILFPLLQKEESNNRNDLLMLSNETILAGIFLALYLPFTFYSTSGMETIFFVTLTVLFLLSMNVSRNTVPLTMLTVLLVLTRPEGILFVSVGILVIFLRNKTKRKPLLPAYAVTLALGVTLGALLLYRLILFNDIVPNTFWAKVGGSSTMHLQWGMQYAWDWVSAHPFIVMLFAVAAAFCLLSLPDWIQDTPLNLSYVGIVLAVFTLYIVRVGGDNYAAFPLWRQFVTIMPFIVLLCSYAIVRSLAQFRYVQLVVLACLVVATNMSLLDVNVNGTVLRNLIATSLERYPTLETESPNPYYLWLKTISHSDTTIASSFGGELPYTVDAIHIDTLGLNTRYIAKNGVFDPNGPQDSKTDMHWVLAQRPDIIEGYISANNIIKGAPLQRTIRRRYQMNYDLISSPIFQQEYCFIRNGPYNYLDRALFFKIAYWTTLPKKDALDCIPISKTNLSQ